MSPFANRQRGAVAKPINRVTPALSGRAQSNIEHRGSTQRLSSASAEGETGSVHVEAY